MHSSLFFHGLLSLCANPITVRFSRRTKPVILDCPVLPMKLLPYAAVQTTANTISGHHHKKWRRSSSSSKITVVNRLPFPIPALAAALPTRARPRRMVAEGLVVLRRAREKPVSCHPQIVGETARSEVIEKQRTKNIGSIRPAFLSKKIPPTRGV